MKAKRRHELQTNYLADLMGRGIERLKQYQHYWPVVVIGAAVVLAPPVWSMWNVLTKPSPATAWLELARATDAENFGLEDDYWEAVKSKLRIVVDKYQGTDAALWAQLDLADVYCLRESGTFDLDKAQELYNEVMNVPEASPLMIRRAALAEAKCWELKGDLAKAIERYREIAETNPGKDFAEEAAKRAEELEQPGAAKFYEWLAQYKPPVSSPAQPGTSLSRALDGEGTETNQSPDSESGKKEKTDKPEQTKDDQTPSASTKKSEAAADPEGAQTKSQEKSQSQSETTTPEEKRSDGASSRPKSDESSEPKSKPSQGN